MIILIIAFTIIYRVGILLVGENLHFDNINRVINSVLIPTCILQLKQKHFILLGHKPVITSSTLIILHIVQFLTFPSSGFPGPAFLIVRVYIFLFQLPDWIQVFPSIANFIGSQSKKTSDALNIDRSEVKLNLTVRPSLFIFTNFTSYLGC